MHSSRTPLRLAPGRTGHCSRSVRIRTSIRRGRYLITARCGGGNLGVAAPLRVFSVSQPSGEPKLPRRALPRPRGRTRARPLRVLPPARASSRRISTNVATIPTAAMIAPAANAPWKPDTSASACVEPPASASCVRDVAIVDSAAMPSAPPICCDVLIRPDASPPRPAGRPRARRSRSARTRSRCRRATSRKPGSRSPRYEPPTDTCVKYTRPAVSAVMPVTSTGFTPTRVTSWAATRRREDRRARDREVRDAGLHRRVAEHLLHVERQHQEHREHRRAHDEARPRSPRSPSGCGGCRTRISGSGCRRSQTTKPTSRASDAAKKPSVSPASQPSLPACVIA